MSCCVHYMISCVSHAQGMSTFDQVHGAMQAMFKAQMIMAGIPLASNGLLDTPVYRAVYDTFKNRAAAKGKRAEGKKDPQVCNQLVTLI
jgi:hypothetical protein